MPFPSSPRNNTQFQFLGTLCGLIPLLLSRLDWLLPHSLLCHFNRGSCTKEIILPCHELKQLWRKHLVNLCIAVDGWILAEVCLHKYCRPLVSVINQGSQQKSKGTSFGQLLVMVMLDRSLKLDRFVAIEVVEDAWPFLTSYTSFS